MGMRIDQNVDVNVMGRGVCRITLYNKDGALTPGGGGTYGTTDWFAQGVFVACLTNTGGADTTHQVFHGVVTDFDLQDDSVFSTVTITALDGLTIGGRTENVTVASAGNSAYQIALAQAIGHRAGVVYPRLGKSTAVVSSIGNIGGDVNGTIYTQTNTYATMADLASTAVIPAANDTLWATKITENGTQCEYEYASIPFTNSRNVANTTDFEFDPPGSLSGSKLPFDDKTFRQEFNNETLVTAAVVGGQYAGAALVTAQASTINTYGSRTQRFTATFVKDATEASNMATKLVNRYSTSRFSPASIQTSATLVKRLADDSAVGKWRHLLDVEKGFWQRVKITWTGSGASSQTAYCVIKGRRISVTPADTVVTLSLGNWADNHAFILNTDQLNTDRLG